MRRSRKSNRVSWASGPNLCQVKLFISDDSPSKVSVPAKEHFIRKPSQVFEHSKRQKANDLPPGFDSILRLRKVNQEAPQIPKIEWRCPPSFVMRSEWCVVAGEESQESSAQELRENGVLEAMYPRRLTIPHSPYLSSEVGAEHWDDSLTPVVPLIPMEEEDAADLEPYFGDPSNPPVSSPTSQPTQKPNSLDIHDPVSEPFSSQNSALSYSGADLVTAASTALAVLVKSTEQTDLIDTNLLVKIFSDPEMIQNLMNSCPTAVATTPPTVASKPDLIPPHCATPIPATSLAQTAVPSWMKPASKPGMTSIPASVPLPAISNQSPVPSSGSSQFLNGFMKLTPPQYSVPVPEMKQLSPPASMPRHVFESFPNPSMVQPGLVNAPPRPSIAPKSSPFAMRPNAVPNHQTPFSNGIRTQPNNSVLHAPWEAAKIDTVKDVNYIKNLIREHGADKQQKKQFATPNLVFQNMELTHNLRPEVEPKFRKPCAYFMKPSGCRKGSSCPFKHDPTSLQWQTGSSVGVPSAKRMKFDGVIEGR